MRPLRDALLAFQFLTRLPVPGGSLAGGDLGRSLAWFPVPGIVMGLLVAGAARLAGDRLPPLLGGTLAVAALAWLSGGLHLDGVADVFDGLSGGHGDREKILRIMRDSRIGAHGATALVLVLAVKTAAIATLVSRANLWPLVAAPALARFTAAPLVAYLPYARDEGLGKAFRGTTGGREVAIAALLAAAALAPSAPGSLVPAVGALAVAAALAAALHRRLGGLTGDGYGAAIELAEAAYLSIACLR